MCRNMAMTVCCNYHIENQSRHSVMLLGSSQRTQSVQQHRNLLRERVGIDVQGVVEAKLCRQRRNGWAMSLARVASVSDGLDAISTSLQLGSRQATYAASKYIRISPRAAKFKSRSRKRTECENEMELLGFPKILTAGG